MSNNQLIGSLPWRMILELKLAETSDVVIGAFERWAREGYHIKSEQKHDLWIAAKGFDFSSARRAS